MTAIRNVGVIDIGKTNAKVAVVDLNKGVEVGVLTCPNKVLAGPPYPHFDLEGHWSFILESLAELHRSYPIDAISVTTHGASLVLLDKNGDLAAPMLDYEFTGPDNLSEAYDAIRPPFEETGSPRLGMGLNAGAQLYWQLQTDPSLSERLATVLTYPQYWSYRLTGDLANEMTSLGCHTDLWDPSDKRYSSLVDRLGLADKMAPVKRADDRMSALLPDVCVRTGLPTETPVACGIHDSNASLYPHLLKRKPPFSVVSTGTWVISLSVGGRDSVLDPTRDTLINVNAFGDPVPSARFMGGREFEVVMKGLEPVQTKEDAETVLQKQIMLLPSVEPHSGPYPGQIARWTVSEEDLSDGERYAAVSFYLAMMTAECLSMTGSAGPIIVEGPFANNALYVHMLEAATLRPVEATKGLATGTSIGAALLVSRISPSVIDRNISQVNNIAPGPIFQAYAESWREAVQMYAK